MRQKKGSYSHKYLLSIYCGPGTVLDSGDILKIETNSDINKSDKYSYEVLTLKLDDFCKIRNIYPTHIKIDVDGAELNVIKGAEEILKRQELKEI